MSKLPASIRTEADRRLFAGCGISFKTRYGHAAGIIKLDAQRP